MTWKPAHWNGAKDLLSLVEKKKTPYLDFINSYETDGQKHEKWSVNFKNTVLVVGHVKWLSILNKYCFYPESKSVFDYECLIELSSFLRDQTLKFKKSYLGSSK
jgi:hypothetical protein